MPRVAGAPGAPCGPANPIAPLSPPSPFGPEMEKYFHGIWKRKVNLLIVGDLTSGNVPPRAGIM